MPPTMFGLGEGALVSVSEVLKKGIFSNSLVQDVMLSNS